MNSSSDFVGLSITELNAGYKNKQFSPVDVAQAFLQRIDDTNKEMNAYITVTHDTALEAAKRAEDAFMHEQTHNYLQGIPVAVKDLMDTKGARTTYGSTMFDQHIPDQDAAVVERLKEAGAIILGKTNTDAFAFGVTTENPYYGAVKNPWREGHVTGGSSGGSSAAVSAGLATAALGSDTAGSVRIPAACCGIVGLKPSAGRVSRRGVMPLSWSLDHVGLLARSAQDAALLLAAIAGPDSKDPLTLELMPLGDWQESLFAGIRIGVPTNWFFDHIDPEIEAIVQNAIRSMEKLGSHIIPVEIAHTEQYFFVFSSIGRAEAAFAHDFLWARKDEYLEGFREFLEDGRSIDAMHFIDASRERERIRGGLVSLFDEVDLIVSPTMPMKTPEYSQPEFILGAHREDTHNALMRLMYPFNLSGHPAASIPCGTTKEGLPVGLQMAGHLGEDWKVLGLAAAWLADNPFEMQKQRSDPL